jgi:muramoyltetrapeptide carboxypeptidase LdcA involved in peptidoglycan recycling
MKIIKSERLKKGDFIAVVSPSWGGPSIFPHIYELGIEILKNLELKIKEYPSARKNADFLYNNPKFRAKDINDAFADPEVKAIFTTIGGDDSIRILSFLDLNIIKKNPKIILGFSDTAVLNTYLNQLGLVTFNGPSIMAGFSQWDSLGKSFQKHIKTFLFENHENYKYKPFEAYCNGYPDWSDKSNAGKTEEMIDNSGWNWIQGDHNTHGCLFGGCIEVLEIMKNTKFWPNNNFWNNKILFLETSEDKPTPNQVKYMLKNYGMQGIFDQISGLIIGRAKDYTDNEKIELDENIIKIISTEFKNNKLPIVTNMDFGHTNPQWILPLGIKAEINCKERSFKLLESPFL